MTSSRGLKLLLPGSWWTIPLENPEDTKASIHRLVAKVSGRADELATLRADLRRRFTSAAQTAREGSASEFYISLEIAPGVPLPASLSVLWPEVYLPSSIEGGDALLAEVRAYVGESGAEGTASIEDVVLDDTVGLRRTSLTVGPALPDDPDSPEVTTLEADYWIVVPGTLQLVVLSFASTLGEIDAALLILFDAIVATAKWDEMREPVEGAVAIVP